MKIDIRTERYNIPSIHYLKKGCMKCRIGCFEKLQTVFSYHFGIDVSLAETDVKRPGIPKYSLFSQIAFRCGYGSAIYFERGVILFFTIWVNKFSGNKCLYRQKEHHCQ